ncbi:uncharacterized protein [Dermacentor andersoni]|uniref:uncharacterized protein n=1 Tax=Dermacentor andersoni TaxID=34620 RepID=UPI0021553DBD|nr:uncharacterized protein LOC126544780 [Dermacentor andersoni]
MLSAIQLVAIAGFPLLVRASVQTPTPTSCQSSQKVMVNDVTIVNAKIGQTMTLNFTLVIKEPLTSNPTLAVTMKRQTGGSISCINDIGSCTYKLCGGTKDFEKKLAQLWNNQCPVPAITVQETIEAKLESFIQFLIGFAPTTITIELKVTDGGASVGCQSFKVNIAA